MCERTTITEDCPGADYTKPVVDSDFVSDFRMECLTLEDVVSIAAGIVPYTIQATAMRLLDFEDLLRRNAQKPITRKRKS